LVNLLDVWREPFYQNAWESTQGLRRGVLGLALALEERHASEGRRLPRGERLREAVSELALVPEGPPLVFPGPLDTRRRTITGGYLSAEEVLRRPVEELALLSLVQEIPTEALEAAAADIREEAEAVRRGGGSADRLERMLISGAMLGASAKGSAVADAVAEGVIAGASSHDPDRIAGSVQVLVFAGASRRREEALVWLEEKLYLLALAIPYGEGSAVLYEVLGELERVMPAEEVVVARARAAASAGAPSDFWGAATGRRRASTMPIIESAEAPST
jgi:hypothetical protein